MYLTEKEILDTPKALKRTCSYFEKQRENISRFFAEHPGRKFVFFGCGSSYMLAKGAAELFRMYPETCSAAIQAGDYVINPELWSNAVRGSILVAISRSGRTSEMVWAIKHAAQNHGCPVISLSMEPENDISPFADLDLTMDWCYDKSVCQTRTVTNLYAALALLAGQYAGDAALIEAVKDAAGQNEAFQQAVRPVLEELASREWTNAVVLADGPLCGIAEEGALAFTEIAMLTGRYFHVLDYRHGPIVVSGPNTVTLMVLQPENGALQENMVRDVMKKGGTVITASDEEGNPYGADAHVCIGLNGPFAAWGIPFIYLCQMLSLLKAIALGGNPDAPTGLDAYITLT